jgi:eukaryotic-like serine/threonine-protein kinase
MGEDNSASNANSPGQPTLDTAGPGAFPAEPHNLPPIGPYNLLRQLGEGGMGQVWLAEQTSPVKRLVALKLIKGGKYDNHVIFRFESERQSLALMNHPVIAKIFDAGTTADGQPYFVMEYVDGPAFTRYCDNKKLKIRERLQLFIKVCEGFQHAHQKAVIHRDLKPSNVLVEEIDGKPIPRIIDFGIAKAVSSQQNSDQTVFTQMGALIGTPGFMSTEQADPSVLDVDTRTDVYSLGVILYVLLTGTLPFDEDQQRKRPLDEILRQLRQEDPPSPSAKMSAEKKTATDSAAKRSTDRRQLVSALRGDLDWITMKALGKDRARRYGTPHRTRRRRHKTETSAQISNRSGRGVDVHPRVLRVRVSHRRARHSCLPSSPTSHQF